MKNLARSLMQAYLRYKFSKKATILGKVYFGRHSRIELSAGSQKKDIIIGDNVKLYGSLISHNGGRITIDAHAHIGPYSVIGAAKGIHIKSFAMISRRVEIIDNNNHPTHPVDRRKMNSEPVNSQLKDWRYSKAEEISIGENTWIGQDARVLKGVEVGENSIVATCAVVTKSIPANVIVAGNPARIVKTAIDRERRIA